MDRGQYSTIERGTSHWDHWNTATRRGHQWLFGKLSRLSPPQATNRNQRKSSTVNSISIHYPPSVLSARSIKIHDMELMRAFLPDRANRDSNAKYSHYLLIVTPQQHTVNLSFVETLSVLLPRQLLQFPPPVVRSGRFPARPRNRSLYETCQMLVRDHGNRPTNYSLRYRRLTVTCRCKTLGLEESSSSFQNVFRSKGGSDNNKSTRFSNAFQRGSRSLCQC
ncbi:hypothetical protein BKA67DRAFT_554504 [Truncatella angustata]|uniref:Uncharacterized protein n=1 Tax=Truncatella angustata TaxID=152316 RepID=A0A9P8USE7_9PEZI|nr:uncharacterized protein BKA67DRAFT_554504 [Truncatella angustata]KAH6657180.1 hypothetical protein BKA67DRAFT_554504 [Truncatella angustata]